jgi:hypothetical protein
VLRNQTVVQKMNADPSLDTLVGQSVSHAWFGDYSALYLELGVLTPSGRIRSDGSPTNPQGEFTVYAGCDLADRTAKIHLRKQEQLKKATEIHYGKVHRSDGHFSNDFRKDSRTPNRILKWNVDRHLWIVPR